MKKMFSIFLSILLSVALTGCSVNIQKRVVPNKINIVGVLFAEYDFARAVSGELCNVTMLLPPGSESHTYEPTPSDIIQIQNCDVFIYGGGESDQWVNTVLESVDENNISVIRMMEICELKEEETVEGMQEEKGEENSDGGEEEPEYDEHIWTSPLNAIKIVNEIKNTLCKIDSENSAIYSKNAETYINKLENLHEKFRKVANNSVRNTIVFADRFPFRYFADEYDLTYYGAFPGCSSEAEPAAKTVKFIIDKVKDEKIPVVFTVEFSNCAIANAVHEATGAEIMQLHSCHNVTKEQFENGVTYLDLMNKNLENLKEALS